MTVNASKQPYGPGLELSTGPATFEEMLIEKRTIFGLPFTDRKTGQPETVEQRLFRSQHVRSPQRQRRRRRVGLVVRPRREASRRCSCRQAENRGGKGEIPQGEPHRATTYKRSRGAAPIFPEALRLRP